MQPLNSRNNLSILILSCDHYADVWPHFFTLFYKYWPDCPWKIFLGTNKIKFNDPKVVSLQIGDDTSWADSAKKVVEKIPTDYLLILLEDFFIQKTVVTNEILDCLTLLRELNGGYLRLRPFPKPDRNISVSPAIGMIDENAPYRLALQAALWKKDVFLQLIQPGETAWDMEIQGTKRSRSIPEAFYCTWDTVIHYRAGITLGKWSPVGVKICQEEKMQIDFNIRSKMTSEGVGKLKTLEVFNNLISIFPWRFRKTIKQFWIDKNLVGK